MKSIQLLLTFLLTSLFVSAQRKDEYLKWPQENVREFPYLFTQFYFFGVETMLPYVEITDSVTGIKRVIPNKKYEKNEYTISINDDPYRFVSFYSPEEINLPPFLDSLPNGKYVQYFAPLPIADQDTLKWEKNKVAAVFQVKNNESIDTVYWYYPQNGLLYQKGCYKAGMRTGEWFSQYIEGNSLGDGTWSPEWSVISATSNYSKGRKHGHDYNYSHYWLYGETPEETIEVTEEQQQYFQNDTLHGKYAHIHNGQPLTLGEFNHGQPSGHWEHYQWKDSLVGGKLILRTRYTFADDSTLHLIPFLVRNLKMERHRQNYDSYLMAEGINAYGIYSSAEAFILQEFDDRFSDFLQVRNCMNDSVVDYRSSERRIPYFVNIFEWSQNHGDARYDSDAVDCGFHFCYSGLAEEYYANGQVKWRLNFDDPETLLNDTVYWRNGNKMNCMRRLKDGFEQLWFDEQGKLLEHIVYTDQLKFKEAVVNPDILKQDGRTYHKYFNNGFVYYHPNTVLASDTSIVLLSSTIMNSWQHSKKDIWFTPSLRKGFQEQHLSDGTTDRVDFQLDTACQTFQLNAINQFGDLSLKGDLSDSLFKSGHPLNGKSLLKGDTLLLGNLDFAPHKWRITNWTLYWKEKPFSGKVLLLYGNNQPFSVQKKGRNLIIQVSDTSSESLLKFLPSLGEIVFGNYPASAKLQSEEDDLLRKALIQSTLNRVEVLFSDGKIDGEISCYGKEKTLLAHMQFRQNMREGTQTFYRHFPYLFDRYYSDRNFYNQPLQLEDLTDKPSEVEYFTNGMIKAQLLFDSNGDTLDYHQWKDQYKSDGYFVSTDPNNYSKTRGYYENDQLIYETITSQDGILLKKADYVLKTYAVYYDNGRLAQSLQLRNESDFDTLFCYDTLGFIRLQQIWKKQVLGELKQFQNGLLVSELFCNPLDSVYFRDERISTSLDISEFIVTKRGYRDNRLTGKVNHFLPGSTCFREGFIKNDLKTGKWNYYPQNGVPYSITYDSASRKNYSKPAYVAILEAPGIRARLLDYEEEYNCLQNEHYERFVPSYTLLNNSTPPDTAVQVKLYFPNGVKMCEGAVVKGLPQGLWRLYHVDGSLFRIGNYSQGKRTGRWLEGDLTKINFLGEYCMNPDTDFYNEQLNLLEVIQIFYEDGVEINRTGAGFRLK